MKVCFIVGTLGCGGAERQLLFMLRALKNEGVHTKVLCLTTGEKYEKEVKALGVDIEWIGRIQNRLYRLWTIIVSVRKYRPDILQSSHFYTNLYSAVAGRLLGIQNIGAIRNDVTSEIAANGCWGKALLKWPQHLIANSDVAISRVVSFGIDPVKVSFVRNVVEENFLDRDLLEKRMVLNVIFVGRLVPAKRAELFIEMASRIGEEMLDQELNFQIIGDGPYRPDLERLASNSGFGKSQLSFQGECQDMAPIYQNADILVLTSIHEGTPNVILEAMGFGVPIVATRVGGVPELLGGKAGILVDPFDFTGLVKATITLISDPKRRQEMGRAGREYVNSHHSPAYLQERLVGTYKQLLNR